MENQNYLFEDDQPQDKPKHEDPVVEIVFVLDQSISMSAVRDSTLNGLNEFIQTHKNQEGKANFTLVKFSTDYDIFYDGEDIKSVKPLKSNDYIPKGMTALYDAIGKAIESVSKRNNNKVIFAIQTDGQENSSQEYKKEHIKELVEEKTKDGWEFLFMGANLDSMRCGDSIGIKSNNTLRYDHTDTGSNKLFCSVTSYSGVVRTRMKFDSEITAEEKHGLQHFYDNTPEE